MCLCLASNTWAEDVTISSASELKAFATRVNGGETSLNAKLTSDITYTGDSYVQIGGNYYGTFDGQGHTVTVAIESTKQGAALFFNNRGTVQNLRVAGTITTSSNNPGGICYYNYGTIRNCAAEVDFTFTGAGVSVTAGGISGQATSGSTIENCMFNGSFAKGEGANENTKNVGGLIGWMDGSPSVRNCLVIASSDLGGDFKPVGRGYNTATSTYYMQKAGSTTSIQTSTGATAVTAEQLASGEIAYKLNGNVSGGTIWMQAIGTDANPSPIGSSIVYAIGSEGNRCDYAPVGTVTSYTNSTPAVSSHTFVDGICSNCGIPQDGYVTLSDGYYQIGTEKQLVWFAAKVEKDDASVNGKMTADIALSSAWTTPIGTQSVPFKGTFDGQNHAITGFNLTYDGGRQGLFGQTNGATIKNFSIDGTIKANGNGGYDAGLGVIGWAEASTIQNVHSSLVVDATGTGLGHTHVGGVVGSLRESGTGSTIERSSFSGEMKGGTNKVDCFGCIVGYMKDYSTISNCANYGKLTYSGSDGCAGGIMGYSWFASSYISNCLNLGDVESDATNSGAIAGRLATSTSHLTNCYWLDGSASKGCGTATISSSVTAAQLASGEVCFGLGSAWYQTLGTDSYPTLDSSKPSVYEIAVGEAGYASFVPTVNVATIPAGVTVYAGQDKGSYLHLEEVTEVPADNAVIVKAAEGSYYFNNTAEARTLGQTNDLKFSATDKTADGKQYCLAKKDVVGFYKVAEGQTIPARKVYLEAETGVKSFFGFDPGDATGLNEVLSVKNEESSAEIFNVAGQRISKMQRGINIVGGKKILK